ncbi:MAG TPA: hypothetical protein VFH77_07325 [Streptomyces sp.]|nr:hypothetical protein [Streptomyces sp.]
MTKFLTRAAVTAGLVAAATVVPLAGAAQASPQDAPYGGHDGVNISDNFTVINNVDNDYDFDFEMFD